MEVIKKFVCIAVPDLEQGVYLKGARAWSRILSREIELIYGGASIGLMGELANTVLQGGGKVTG